MSNGVAQAVIRKEELIKLKSELLDSIKSRGNYDTIRVSTADSSVIDSLRLLMKEIQKLKEGQAKPEQMAQPAQNIALAKSSAADSAYKNWIKNSVKLYEAMETKKAAKILQTYSDNIAREIIFKMKKRKAAEIIAEIKPDIASRIMSVQ
jgi:flagellar motility protein MotE (MotC chaperone)